MKVQLYTSVFFVHRARNPSWSESLAGIVDPVLEVHRIVGNDVLDKTTDRLAVTAKGLSMAPKYALSQKRS